MICQNFIGNNYKPTENDCLQYPPVAYYTLEEIKQLCLQYDKKYDCHPESVYQGRAIYAFIVGKDEFDEEFNNWEKDMKND